MPHDPPKKLHVLGLVSLWLLVLVFFVVGIVVAFALAMETVSFL